MSSQYVRGGMCAKNASPFSSSLANQIFSKLVSTGSSHRLRFDRVLQFHAEVRSIAHDLLNLLGLIRERQSDVRNARALERVNLVKQKRAIANGDDRFRCVDR